MVVVVLGVALQAKAIPWRGHHVWQGQPLRRCVREAEVLFGACVCALCCAAAATSTSTTTGKAVEGVGGTQLWQPRWGKVRLE